MDKLPSIMVTNGLVSPSAQPTSLATHRTSKLATFPLALGLLHISYGVTDTGIRKRGQLMGFMDRLQQESSFSTATGGSYQYVILQVTLKEKLWGTGSGNLTELEDVINKQAAKGYRLHTISTATGGSKGLGGGDRIQATMVFERLQ